jgi:hypothetical protein
MNPKTRTPEEIADWEAFNTQGVLTAFELAQIVQPFYGRCPITGFAVSTSHRKKKCRCERCLEWKREHDRLFRARRDYHPIRRFRETLRRGAYYRKTCTSVLAARLEAYTTPPTRTLA